MDRYPSVFGETNDQLAEVLREIVRKRDSDVTSFSEIYTDPIKALAALTPTNLKFPAFTGANTAQLLDLPVTNANTVFESSDFINNTTVQGNYFGSAIASGTTAPSNNSSATHPGVTELISSASANSGYAYRNTARAIQIAGSETFNCIFRIETLSNALFRAGFHDDIASPFDATDGLYFAIDNTGAAVGTNANNTVRSTTATVATLSTATWYHCRITVNSNATSVLYEIFDDSGTSLGSQSLTTNIPTGSGRLCGATVLAAQTVGATATLMSVDYIDFRLNRKIQRGAFQ